jgi:hypothetical protein
MQSAIVQTAAERLKKVSPLRPKLAIVLGSGFHHVLKACCDAVVTGLKLHHEHGC